MTILICVFVFLFHDDCISPSKTFDVLLFSAGRAWMHGNPLECFKVSLHLPKIRLLVTMLATLIVLSVLALASTNFPNKDSLPICHYQFGYCILHNQNT